MRPSTLLLMTFFLFIGVQLVIHQTVKKEKEKQVEVNQQMSQIVERFGLSDLCVATDARYIRHLSISDPISPYMDHPGAIEHFPSSSFRVPVH